MNEQENIEIAKKPSIIMIISLIMAILAFIMGLLALIFSIFSLQKEKTLSREEICAVTVPATVELRGNGMIGSGVIMKLSDGFAYIITNRHVANTVSPAARFIGESDFLVGELLGFDEYHDIAAVKIPYTGNRAKAAVLGTEIPVFGEEVLVVGNALGKGISVFDGILSNPDRILEADSKVIPVYQITAPVNAGCSGGGLFNDKGELIGINTYQSIKSSDEGGTDTRPVDGMSYSVPITIAKEIFLISSKEKSGEQIKKVSVKFSKIGESFELRFESLNLYAKRINGKLNITYSYLTINMSEELKVGDEIVAIGELDITESTNFSSIFGEIFKYEHKMAGTTLLKIKVSRNGQYKTITFKDTIKR